MECPIDHTILSQNDAKPISFYPISGNKVEAIIHICPKCHRKYIYIEGSSNSQVEYSYHGNTLYNINSPYLMDALQYKSNSLYSYSPMMEVNKKNKRVKVAENKKSTMSYHMAFGSKSEAAQERAFTILCPSCGKYVASLFSDKGICWECYKEQMNSRFD